MTGKEKEKIGKERESEKREEARKRLKKKIDCRIIEFIGKQRCRETAEKIKD